MIILFNFFSLQEIWRSVAQSGLIVCLSSCFLHMSDGSPCLSFVYQKDKEREREVLRMIKRVSGSNPGLWYALYGIHNDEPNHSNLAQDRICTSVTVTYSTVVFGQRVSLLNKLFLSHLVASNWIFRVIIDQFTSLWFSTWVSLRIAIHNLRIHFALASLLFRPAVWLRRISEWCTRETF